MDRMLCIAVFVSAIEEGSIAAAARRHGLSSAMAGRYLVALEESVPARLVERTTRRLRPTDAGRAFYERCRRLLDEYEEATIEAAESHTAPRGTLRITAPIAFGTMVLGPIVGDFMREFPGVTVSVHLHDHFVDLVEEGMDLALRVGRLPDSSLVARPVSRCSLLACASPSYVAARGTPHAPEQLLEHDRIDYIGSLTTPPWSFARGSAKPHSIDAPSRFVANSTPLMLEVALAGAGIAYGPSFVFADALRSGRLVQVLPEYQSPVLPIHVITPTSKHATQKAKLFSDRLRDAFADDPPWETWRDARPARRARARQR